MQLVLLHVFGIGGGLLAKRLRIPAGGLIGSLLAVLLFNTFSRAYPLYPLEFRVVIQMFAGLVIGCRFTRSDIRNLKLMIKPVVLLVLLLILINLLFAFLMAQVSNVSLMTAFFACAPGGVSDLALVAADFGAEMEQVAILQLFRLMFVVVVFPPIMKKMFSSHPIHPLHAEPDLPSADSSSNLVGKGPAKSGIGRLIWMVVSSIVAITGGYLFNYIGFPAGAIVGAIFSIILLNLATDKAAYPRVLKTIVQLLAGCYIGSKMTSQVLSEIPKLMLPLAVLIIELFFMAFVTAYIIHKLTKLNFATALFSSIPGGITEMSIISEEMGLDTPKIVLMHTCRIIAVLAILPSLVRFLNFH